jgi:hypothetical protein
MEARSSASAASDTFACVNHDNWINLCLQGFADGTWWAGAGNRSGGDLVSAHIELTHSLYSNFQCLNRPQDPFSYIVGDAPPDPRILRATHYANSDQFVLHAGDVQRTPKVPIWLPGFYCVKRWEQDGDGWKQVAEGWFHANRSGVIFDTGGRAQGIRVDQDNLRDFP